MYLRAFRFQLALPMPDKTAEAVRARLDELEKAAPKAFARLFPLVLTDNGAEFADSEGIERSALDPAARRCSVYYCDVRQSQQKGGCERNHVEVRKILPKGRGISFDRLGGRDCAALMSQLNSEPRPSLGGMCAIDMTCIVFSDTLARGFDALEFMPTTTERTASWPTQPPSTPTSSGARPPTTSYRRAGR